MSTISFLIEYKFTVLFYTFVILIVYLNRKKFDIHGKIIALYRTKIGINFMDGVAKKSGKLIRLLGYVGVFFGFAGVVFIFFGILNLVYKLIINAPGAGGASPVIPGLPIAGTGIVFPLVTGWIALFIIIVVHEFSHGIVARAHNIEVKSSGLAFFGPIFGAFVEPDEKKLAKQKDSVQHSVFAAGPFSNFILYFFMYYIVILLIISPTINAITFSSGVILSPQPDFPADKAGITNNTKIIKLNELDVITVKDFQKAMKNIKPNEKVVLSSENKTYFLTTTENPETPSKGYLGVFVLGEDTHLINHNIFLRIFYEIIKWFLRLSVWTALISLNIGLINLLPVFITDGARMLKVACERMLKDKKTAVSVWLGLNWISVIALVTLVFLPLFRWISSKLSIAFLGLLA